MRSEKGFGIVEGIIVLVVIALVGAVGYYVIQNQDDDSEDDTAANSQVEQQPSSDFPLDVSFSNLARLEQGVYEGWVVRDGTKYSFGTFNMSDSGSIEGSFSLSDITPQNGDTVAITIEPDNDSNPEASTTIVLDGEIKDGSAQLAFPVDVSSFAGEYILGTPTTATTADETAGIWFTLSGTETLLDIPVAPDGWIYEGWVVFDGQPLTAGKFADPSKGDDFNGYSGPGNAPDKPGEDYITNLPNGLTGPLELADGDTQVVVSLEPFQNGSDPTGDGPAQVKPLSHTIGQGVADHTAFSLDTSADSVPSGSASLR